MAHSLPIIIIGTGLAGYTLAKEFRKQDLTTPLLMITQDDGHFYSKPLLSTAHTQQKSAQDLVITDVTTMQQQLNAMILTFSTVTHIDAGSQTLSVQTADSVQHFAYQKLVFAMGAKPKPLPILANCHPHYRINSLLDYSQFRAAQSDWQHLTILGSGLVGCEFAHDFSKTTLSIDLVTPDPYPLFGLVPEPIGKALQRSLTEKGIVWHTQTQIDKASRTHSQCTLTLSSQKTLQTDALLAAIGLTPQCELAKGAGLAVNQGIIVDDDLRASVANHYALGDCAEIQGHCRQFVAPILVCARALAQTLLGNPTPVKLPALPVTLKVECYPIIATPIKPNLIGSWDLENQGNDFKGLFYDQQGTLQGYVLSGAYLAERQKCMQALANVS